MENISEYQNLSTEELLERLKEEEEKRKRLMKQLEEQKKLLESQTQKRTQETLDGNTNKRDDDNKPDRKERDVKEERERFIQQLLSEESGMLEAESAPQQNLLTEEVPEDADILEKVKLENAYNQQKTAIEHGEQFIPDEQQITEVDLTNLPKNDLESQDSQENVESVDGTSESTSENTEESNISQTDEAVARIASEEVQSVHDNHLTVNKPEDEQTTEDSAETTSTADSIDQETLTNEQIASLQTGDTLVNNLKRKRAWELKDESETPIGFKKIDLDDDQNIPTPTNLKKEEDSGQKDVEEEPIKQDKDDFEDDSENNELNGSMKKDLPSEQENGYGSEEYDPYVDSEEELEDETVTLKSLLDTPSASKNKLDVVRDDFEAADTAFMPNNFENSYNKSKNDFEKNILKSTEGFTNYREELPNKKEDKLKSISKSLSEGFNAWKDKAEGKAKDKYTNTIESGAPVANQKAKTPETPMVDRYIQDIQNSRNSNKSQSNIDTQQSDEKAASRGNSSGFIGCALLIIFIVSLISGVFIHFSCYVQNQQSSECKEISNVLNPILGIE